MTFNKRRSARTSRGRGRPRPRPTGILAAGFLALIIVAGSVAFAVHHHRPHASGAAASTTALPPETVAVTPGAVGGVFGVPQADPFGRRVDIPTDPAGELRPQQPGLHKQPSAPDWLTAAPAGLCRSQDEHQACEPGGWQRVHGAVVPFSTSDGPTRLVQGVAAGYAHTPQGAALAAAYSAYEVAARPGDRVMLATRLLLPPAEQQAFDAGIRAGTLPIQQDQATTRWMLAWDAFEIQNYTDDFAVIELAARAPDTDATPTWNAVTIPMVWHNDDWLVRGTGTQLPVQPVHQLAGWTPW